MPSARDRRRVLATVESSVPHSAAAPVATPERSRASSRHRLETLRRGLTAVGLLATGGLAWWWLATHHFGVEADHDPVTAAVAEPAADANVVSLPAAVAADQLTLATAELRPLRQHLTVPGRLDYDARHRIDYAAPVSGIVSQVLVQVRQRVAKGDSLAEVSSPDVGMARDEVQKRHDDRDIARKAADWAATIATNVEELLAALQEHPPLERIERQFQDRVLGAYRETILGAYSKLLFTEKVSASTRQLGEGGVLSGRIVEERTSNLEVAKANFTAACEEAMFDTRQDRDRAQAALQQAERLVQVSHEHLRTLVGSTLDIDVVDRDDLVDLEANDDASPSSLSALVLRTPFDDIVEDVFVSRGERVQSGEKLFVVADTSSLWVRAQIHERQWTTVEVAEGQQVQVTVPGAEAHEAQAVVSHVAATVDPKSRSVPIVADLNNDDAHFKPGMFVWVELPQGEARDALAVPAAAIMRHEGRAFVFTPADGGFRPVDIDTGIETDDFVEVTRGLDAGQQVVDRGAFLLKSELLLEDEG